MKRIPILIFLFAIAISSCTKEDTELRLPDFTTPSIKGYYQRDFHGLSMGIVGNPNVRLGNGTDYTNSTYYFVTYPNPSSDNVLFIYVKAPTDHEKKLVWITPAYWDNQGSNYIINKDNYIIIGGHPYIQAEFTSDHLMIDVSLVPQGYYRIYLKVNDHLLYDNIVIN
ncbi:MAG: hypothetical protein M0Q41_00350 [Bacteroidales bacterium]|nr:hypothetical protein [Bacteroidales bacterium]